MRINTNISAMNAHRQLGVNQGRTSSSLERLSSGLRINRAGDDAAGLAISEKMRGQIRGLRQASRNAQDAISLIQTAEGSLSETHAILQRMRELAVQSANDTNVNADRTEIQNEINQLSSETNRIGNTTEFNTQRLLRGDSVTALDATGAAGFGNLTGGATTHVEANVVTTIAGTGTVAGDSVTFGVEDAGGVKRDFTITFAAETAGGHTAGQVYNVTATSATVNLMGATSTPAQTVTSLDLALDQILAHEGNADLQGGYTASTDGTAIVTLAAEADGIFAGGKGTVFDTTTTATATLTVANVLTPGTTTLTKADQTINFTGVDGASLLDGGERGEGITINGVQLEFYDANAGAYTGDAIGINIASTATAEQVVTAIVNQATIEGVTLTVGATATDLLVTANVGGEVGNNIVTSDGGVQRDFTAVVQIGANKGQSFSMDISDMRAQAIGITGAAGADGFTTANTVSNGTDTTLREASLDVSTQADATAAVAVLDSAIETVSAERSKLGAFQNRLEHTISNLGTSAENLQAAESRIRDVDMAAEMMEFTKLSILNQAATAMLAQASMAPQLVLQLLG